jgi:NAD(P)-dependent dehydrogenase (short-subunit alcohol dehydrogenase family)
MQGDAVTSAVPVPQRTAVLSTGMSGTGKSTVLEELARRGHRVVDTDDRDRSVEARAADGPEPLWDLNRVRVLLEEHRSGCLFVAGCVADQGLLHDRWDKAVLPSAPVDVVLAPVARRGDPFGSTTKERATIARDLAASEPALRTGADHEIVTTALIPVVASKSRSSPRRSVERSVAGTGGSRSGAATCASQEDLAQWVTFVGS